MAAQGASTNRSLWTAAVAGALLLAGIAAALVLRDGSEAKAESARAERDSDEVAELTNDDGASEEGASEPRGEAAPRRKSGSRLDSSAPVRAVEEGAAEGRDGDARPIEGTSTRAGGPEDAFGREGIDGAIAVARQAGVRGAAAPLEQGIGASEAPDLNGRTRGGGITASERSDAADTVPASTSADARGCGDGVVAGLEECEPPGSPTCSHDCLRIQNDDCYSCAQETPCIVLANGCIDVPRTPEDQALCYEVLQCIQDTACAAGNSTLTSCYCGSLSTAECADSGYTLPDGMCAPVIREAFGGDSATSANVLTRYTLSGHPGGPAIKYLNCLKTNPKCGPICFPGDGL